MLPLHGHRLALQTEGGLLPLLLLRVPLRGRLLRGLQRSAHEARAGPSRARGRGLRGLQRLPPLPPGRLPAHGAARPFQPLRADQPRSAARGLRHRRGLRAGLLGREKQLGHQLG